MIAFYLSHFTSPRAIKLYESSAIHGLLLDHRETPCLALDDWNHIERLLLGSDLDA
jgi:hypothetical protein